MDSQSILLAIQLFADLEPEVQTGIVSLIHLFHKQKGKSNGTVVLPPQAPLAPVAPVSPAPNAK